ncbi:MAG: cytochrome c3 family protein [Armatimonadetes bacterium]|nr:cytochrome c3 family protein [Armatimonadota bacterium]MDE2206825.1 cytochrome c3 family protein [Armatimonadota bacterium]
MAQVFPPAANVLARLSIGGGVALVAATFVLGSGITRTSYNTKVNVPLNQPIPFSHEHHATELGIDCRYCHTTVETSATAGVPPTQTCMSCHSQIWTNSPLLEPIRESYRTGKPIEWNKVNAVPDFVYFNHSVHVNAGLNCNLCHGPVQTMQLTYKAKTFFMTWCLACHRDPAQHVGARSKVFSVYQDYQRGMVDSHGNPVPDEEKSLLLGDGYTRGPNALATANHWMAVYHIDTTQKQLTDCWTCHR